MKTNDQATRLVRAWDTTEDTKPPRKKDNEKIIPDTPCMNMWCHEPWSDPNNIDTRIMATQRAFLSPVMSFTPFMGKNRNRTSSIKGVKLITGDKNALW